MKRRNLAFLALSGVSLAAPAVAQDSETYDRIDLSASASLEVENDILTATVFAEVENNDQSDAAEAVNEAIAWAAERAREVADIEIQTSNYSTRPVYANGRRITGWIARQSLRLESEDAEALSELLGELQEVVAIQSINYSISKAAREAAEEALIAEALAQFNRRATLVANELGRRGFRIVRLSVNTNGANPGFFALQRDAMEVTGVRAPEIQAGNQTLTVSVNGTVELETSQ